jgi:hypothetical protein
MSTLQQTYQRLCRVLQQLHEKNLHHNKGKCQFFKTSVCYLGHEIDEHRLHPIKDKINTIVNIPHPTDASKVHTFLGMINYYHKLGQPLHQLIKKDAEFIRDERCETSFQRIKTNLISSRAFVHFDPNLALVLATYATPYGLEVVLSHVMLDGSEQPIAFRSRTLIKSEANYSQIGKEATAIVWGLKKPAFSAMRKLHCVQYIDEITFFQLNQIKTLLILKKQLQDDTRSDPDLRDIYNTLIKGGLAIVAMRY